MDKYLEKVIELLKRECGSIEEIHKMEEEAGRILGNDCMKQAQLHAIVKACIRKMKKDAKK